MCDLTVRGKQTANVLLEAMISLCWHNGCQRIVASGDNKNNGFNFGYYNFTLDDESFTSEKNEK